MLAWMGRTKETQTYLMGAQWEDAQSRSPSINSPIESLAPDASVGESRQPVEIIGQTSLPQSLHMAVEERRVPEGGSPLTSPTDVTEASEGADPKCQITQFLEGGMSKILRAEDAIDVVTSVLLTAAKMRIQAGKFGFKMILIGTTTNTADIRKYTEQSIVELPVK
jgi:hypothetical protein